MFLHAPPEVLLRTSLFRQFSVLSKQTNRTTGGFTVRPRICSGRRTYKAVVCTKLGQPLSIQQRELPNCLGENEVLISVHGVGVNFADILVCQGKYQSRLLPPFTPGFEVSGKVVDIGSKVQNLIKGDRVCVLSPGNNGGAAEFCVADAHSCFPAPKDISLVQAASTLVSYGTAMLALTRQARVKPNQKVLITAAAGSTGLAAIDIAKNIFNCQVIAVCGGKEKCEFVKERGADFAIDYTKEGIRQGVKEITNGSGVNIALDQVGGDSLLDCVKSLAFEGKAVTIGYASGIIPNIPANQLLLRSASLSGVFWGNYSVQDKAAFIGSINLSLKGISQGQLTPYCGKTFSLHEMNEAYQYVLDRKSVGKVVIRVKDGNEDKDESIS